MATFKIFLRDFHTVFQIGHTNLHSCVVPIFLPTQMTFSKLHVLIHTFIKISVEYSPRSGVAGSKGLCVCPT